MLTVYSSDLNHVIASIDNTVITIWKKETTTMGVLALQRAIVKVNATSQMKVAAFSLIARDAPQPSKENRAAIEKIIKACEPILLSCTYVFEAEGFQASIVRNVVSIMIMRSKPKFAYTVTKSIAEGVQWTVEQLRVRGQPHSGGDQAKLLMSTINDLRSAPVGKLGAK